MISVSNDFKQAMKEPVKQLSAYIIGDNIDIRDSNDLVQFKVSADSGLCKTTMRKLEAKILGSYDLLGKWVHVGFGVKLAGGTYEYLDYGSFLITEVTNVKDSEITNIVGYDKMINSMTKYEELNVNYPISLYNYTVSLCNAFGASLANESFDVLNDWSIDEELWENINGITYRDILQQIAQITCTTVIITNDDEIYFKPITNTNETLTYENMFKLKLEPIYGEINSVVLSRTPQEDNVYERDDESIEINGLTEWKIENNQIIDKNRDDAMEPIYTAMRGISYYPFETTTEGLGWYEIADSFNIVNDNGDVFNTTLFNFNITIDGGIKEVLKTNAETKTQTQYQYATTVEKRIRNAEIIVDKQNNKIESIVTTTENLTNEVVELGTTVTQTAEELNISVQQLNDKVNDSIENGAESLRNKLVTIDISGISVATNLSKISTIMTNDTFAIRDNTGTYLAYFGYDETEGRSKAEMDNLTINNYFTAGYHRIEKFDIDNEHRTGWFYVGGDN